MTSRMKQPASDATISGCDSEVTSSRADAGNEPSVDVAGEARQVARALGIRLPRIRAASARIPARNLIRAFRARFPGANGSS